MRLADRTVVVYWVVAGHIAVDETVVLAAEGARCALVGTDPAALEEIAALARAVGGYVETAVLDPADAAAVEDHLDALLRSTGRIDASVHVAPAAAAVRAVARHMVRQAAGVIVLVGDAAARSGVEAARLRWQHELAPHGVRLVTLLPTLPPDPGGDLCVPAGRIAAIVGPDRYHYPRREK